MFAGILRPSIRHFFLKKLITRSILLFFLIVFFSTLSGIFLTKTTPFHLGLLHLARRIEYILPFFAGLHLAQNKKHLLFFCKLLIPISLGVLFYGIAQLYFKAPVISTQNEEFSKGFILTLQPGVNLSSTFAGHYDLAAFSVFPLLLILGLAMTGSRHRLRRCRLP